MGDKQNVRVDTGLRVGPGDPCCCRGSTVLPYVRLETAWELTARQGTLLLWWSSLFSADAFLRLRA